MSEEKIIDKKKNKLPIIIGIIFVAVIAVVAFVVINATGSKDKKVQKKLELAAQYLTDMDYENAIATYEEVLDINPKCADAYIGIADSYVAMAEQAVDVGDKDKAKEYYLKAIENLDKGLDIVSEEDREKLEKKKNEITKILNFEGEEEFKTKENNDDLDNKDELENDFAEKEDLLCKGVTNNLLTPEEIKFLGYDVKTLTINDAKNIIVESGGLVTGDNKDENEDYDWCSFSMNNQEFENSSLLQYHESKYIDSIGYGCYGYDWEKGINIGIRNIEMGDSAGVVIDKIGFSTGTEIEEKCRKLSNTALTEEDINEISYEYYDYDKSIRYEFYPDSFSLIDGNEYLNTYTIVCDFEKENIKVVFVFNETDAEGNKIYGGHTLNEVYINNNIR